MGLNVPVVCVVIGEGGSGGALAIGIGNHVHSLARRVFGHLARSFGDPLSRAGACAAGCQALKPTAQDSRPSASSMTSLRSPAAARTKTTSRWRSDLRTR